MGWAINLLFYPTLIEGSALNKVGNYLLLFNRKCGGVPE